MRLDVRAGGRASGLAREKATMSAQTTRPGKAAAKAAAEAAQREAIRTSSPLSIVSLTSDRMACCNVCGGPSEVLEVWRAHDERDQPIAGNHALVFLGAGDSHKACHAKLDAHPRAFAEEEGRVGHLPRLCGPCTFRRGLACAHPDSKANGGAGLEIRVAAMSGVVCFGKGRGGCKRILQPALECVGRTLANVNEKPCVSEGT